MERHCSDGAEALLIFAGADAYVSPGFYPSKAEHGKVVPTWNYVAVHAYGRAEIFSDAERLLDIVSALTDRHEAGRAQPWTVADAPADYIDGMLKAIVGFAIPDRPPGRQAQAQPEPQPRRHRRRTRRAGRQPRCATTRPSPN